MTTCRCIHTLEENYTVSAQFSPDGKQVLSVHQYFRDISLKLWNIDTGECIRTLSRSHDGSSYHDSICFSPDGKQVLWGRFYDKYKSLNLWNLETGEFSCLGEFSVSSVCFSPDGKLILSGDTYNTIRIWNFETGKFRILKGHTNTVNSVCFSPDGKLVMSGSSDSSIKLWEIKTGKCIRTLTNYVGEAYRYNPVSYVCFSPDGKLAMSYDGDTVKLWDLETGECIQILEGTGNICFNQDGCQIAIDSYLYDLDYDLHFPGWQDWDEGARPYIDIFLTLHPNWTEDDFNNILIPDLQNRGYGWLRPEGVKVKLKEMSNKKTSFWKRIIHKS